MLFALLGQDFFRLAASQGDTGRECKEAIRALLRVLAFLREQPIPVSKAPVRSRQKYVP